MTDFQPMSRLEIVQNSSEFFITAEVTESCKYFTRTLTKLLYTTVQLMFRKCLSGTSLHVHHSILRELGNKGGRLGVREAASA